METLEDAIAYLEKHLMPKQFSEDEDSSGPQVNSSLLAHIMSLHAQLEQALSEIDDIINGE